MSTNNAYIWSKTDFSKTLVLEYLDKHSRLLNWKDYKENILEVGCGDGSLTKHILCPYIQQHLEKLIAIDKLESMIDFAKKHHDAPHIVYQVMDITDQREIERMNSQFDHIFVLLTLHWISDHKTLLENFYKMLKPSGQIFVVTIVNSAIHQSFDKHFANKTWSQFLPDEKVFYDYTEDPETHFKGLVDDAGFNVDLCEVQKRSTVIENFPDFLRAVISFNKDMEKIPAELQIAYFEDHLQNCYNQYPPEEGVYKLRYESLICIASKSVNLV